MSKRKSGKVNPQRIGRFTIQPVNGGDDEHVSTPITSTAPPGPARVRISSGDGGGGGGAVASAPKPSILAHMNQEKLGAYTHELSIGSRRMFPDRLNNFDRIGIYNRIECEQILEKWIRDNSISEVEAKEYRLELNAIFHHPEHKKYRLLRESKYFKKMFGDDCEQIISNLKKINGGPYVQPRKIRPPILKSGRMITFGQEVVHDNILKLLGVYQEEVGGIKKRRKSRKNTKGRKNKKSTKSPKKAKSANKKKGKKNSKKQKKK